MNKTRQLAVWMYKTRSFRTSDLLRFGVENFSTRADRSARRFRELGLIRRVSIVDSDEDGYIVNIDEMENYLRV